MAWAIRFISQAELADPNGGFAEVVPPNFTPECLPAEVPGSVDLTAYFKQLAESNTDRILVAQQGAHISLPSMLVDSEAQGHFQFIANQLWYKDGPSDRPSQNGTGILNPRDAGGAYTWDGHDWTNVRNLFIPIATYQIYMLFPGGVFSKKVPSYLASVYHFADQQSGTAQAQASQQTPQPVQAVPQGTGVSSN